MSTSVLIVWVVIFALLVNTAHLVYLGRQVTAARRMVRLLALVVSDDHADDPRWADAWAEFERRRDG